jgi:hypothetical protein
VDTDPEPTKQMAKNGRRKMERRKTKTPGKETDKANEYFITNIRSNSKQPLSLSVCLVLALQNKTKQNKKQKEKQGSSIVN